MSYCRYTTDEGCFQNWARRLVAKKRVECQVVNNVNAAIVGELRQVPFLKLCVWAAAAAGGGAMIIGKVFGAKTKRIVFCFSVCLCLLFCLFSWVFLRDSS